MEDPAFRQWLAAKSWTLCVRYCKVVLYLLPVAALAMDLPLLLGQRPQQLASLKELLAWQFAVGIASAAVLVADRCPPAREHAEGALYASCAAFMVLVTWIGVRSIQAGGTGIAIYAAGATFLAAVICTPLPVRLPMYVASLLAIAVTAWSTAPESAATLNTIINTACVVVLCLAVDRHTYARAIDLFAERQALERERLRADHVLANVLPAAVAAELKANGVVRPRKVPKLGVLFADIVGFTDYARRLPPDALVFVLGDIFTRFDALVEREGVEKIKTIGDAYMAVSENDVAALCRLALGMRQALDNYNEANGTTLAMRIGVHTGPAVAGVLGVQRFLYDVWGDTVNVASRLESAGEPGSIQVSEAVVRQAGDGFAFRARGLVDLPGRGRMLTWWLLDPAEVQDKPVLQVVAA